MTPKEKAYDLFITYRFATSLKDAPLGMSKDNIAKQCGLIAVDEILDLLSRSLNPPINYWQEVKQEIDKL